MAEYHVGLESRATASQASEYVTVRMIAPTYSDAWVDARTVCRLGTNSKRVLKKYDEDSKVSFDEAENFTCAAGVYTVRKIFVANTRKKGKKRMTTLTSDEFLKALSERGIHVSKKLTETLKEVMADSDGGGLRVTSATARRLGIESEDESIGEDEDKKTA